MTTTSSKASENAKQPQIGSQWVNNKYALIHKLHEGLNSKIFIGAFMKNSKQVTRAIKIEPIRTSTSGGLGKGPNMGLKNEINVLRHIFMNEYGKIDFKVGFPHLFEFGAEHHSNYIVMGMYGPNLAQLMRLCGGKFSARTTYLIGLQILDRLEDIHQKKYLYGGISPENFMVGVGKESYLIYMTDFGKSTVYKSKNKNVHIPYQQTNAYQNPNFDHTFLSLNCQLGIQGSRRDDIEAFMYLLLYMYKGRLPWVSGDHAYGVCNNSNLLSEDQVNQENPKQSMNSSQNLATSNPGLLQEQRNKILEIKRRISPESLFKSLSFELIDLMHYVKTLSFYQKPDYIYIRKKLWSALMETDYEELRNNIIIYDWNQREPLDYEIYRESPKFKLKAEKDRDRDQVNQNESRSLRGSENTEGASRKRGMTNSCQSDSNERRAKGRTSVSKRISKTSDGPQMERRKGTDIITERKPESDREKMKIDRVVESDDDANVMDEDDGMKPGSEPETNKIDEKLKIINEIDEECMNVSLYKDNSNAKKEPNCSRFKGSPNSEKESLL